MERLADKECPLIRDDATSGWVIHGVGDLGRWICGWAARPMNGRPGCGDSGDVWVLMAVGGPPDLKRAAEVMARHGLVPVVVAG